MTRSAPNTRSSQSRRADAAPTDRPPSRWRTGLTLLVLGLAVLAVYFPIKTNPGDNTLQGGDYLQLHLFRIRFAREALFSVHPHLPGWYPRELLGTPFWSDIQNFPLIPTRLILLLVDPLSAFAVGVILAAELAALFTFVYARTIGLSRVGAAAAAWTFACSGFFAARVLCGHLPLLEAYPALPLLLWLVHRCLFVRPGLDQARRQSNALRLLGGTTTLVCLAGHPQIPAYAISAAAVYAAWMSFRRADNPRRESIRILATLGLAVGVAAFMIWPLLLLAARSSRVLPIDHADNDIVLPYQRLLAFILPWRDGWPPSVLRPPSRTPSYGNAALFWETVCYVGLLPLIAAAVALGRVAIGRIRPGRAWAFVATLGIAGVLLALPPAHELVARVPGTFLRSPARLLYFTLFALSLGFGAAVSRLGMLHVQRPMGKVLAIAAVAAVLVFQAIDLGRHDRCFIRTCQYWTNSPAERGLREEVGTGRVAIDFTITIPLNRELDDIGTFDSILLAKPYRALLDLGNLPPRTNTEYLEGSELTVRALRVCAVRVVITEKGLPGTPPSSSYGTVVNRLAIARSAKRVDFFPLDSAVIADVPTIHEKLRDPQYDLLHYLLIPSNSATPPTGLPSQPLPASIAYTRNSEDEMTISATVPQSGYLRIDEAWDPGWHATVDGKAVPLIAGDDVFLTLPLPAGNHKVRLEFSTPGAAAGWIISAASFILLFAVTRRK